MTSLSPGIFASLRKNEIDLTDSSYVNITCPERYWTNREGGDYFCVNPSLEGGPPYVVVDGTMNFA